MLSFVPDTMFWNLQFNTCKQAMSNNVFKLLEVPLKVIKDPRIFLSSELRHFLLIHLLLKGFGWNPRHFNYHKMQGDLMVTRLWKGKLEFQPLQWSSYCILEKHQRLTCTEEKNTWKEEAKYKKWLNRRVVFNGFHSIKWLDVFECTLPWVGCESIAGLSPASNSPALFHKPWWREGLWE